MGSRRDKLVAAAIAGGFGLLLVGGFLLPAGWQPFHHWMIVFFSWPSGSVWSNMLAWVLCGGLAFFWTHRVLARHHAEHMAKLEQIHSHLKATHPLPEA